MDILYKFSFISNFHLYIGYLLVLLPLLVWRRFLQDYEAVISDHKSAETLLAEISKIG